MRTRGLDSGEVVTFEEVGEGQEARVEAVGEGQVAHAEPGELAAPATPHLYQESPLLGFQDGLSVNLSDWSEMLNRFVCVSESVDFSPYGYIDILELRTINGLVERASKFHIVGALNPAKAWTYSYQVVGTKLFTIVSSQQTGSMSGTMICVDLETYEIDWQDAQRKVGDQGDGIYSDFGVIQATQYAYGLALIYSGARYMVMKYTLAGTLVWQKQFAHATSWERISVAENADGSLFIACGNILEKWDTDGNRLWSKKIAVQGAGATAFSFFTLQKYADALYATVSSWAAPYSFFCRLDLDGEVVWSRIHAGYRMSFNSVNEQGGYCALFKQSAPFDSVIMHLSHDNEVRWARSLTCEGAANEAWTSISSGNAYVFIVAQKTAGNYGTLVLPANGSGQGTYGDNAADRIGKWVYENCDEPAAGAQTISMVDDAGFTLPTPYALEAAPEVVELLPVIQHFGAST